MKKLLCCLCLVLCTLTLVQAEVLKCKTYAYSTKTRAANGNWHSWSEWETSDLLVVLDTDNDRIKIYNEANSTYDLVEYLGERIDSDGDMVYTWNAVDEEGIECVVQFIKIQNDNRLQMYWKYDNVMFVFYLKAL